MHELKPLSAESIPNALEKAKHYRLLNEPWQAESICRDILKIDSNNQQALLILVLAITDQFGVKTISKSKEAKRVCAQLENEYEQIYYRGLISERIGKAALKRATPRSKYIAFEYYMEALDYYKQAEKLQPDDNQESVLRWNACVRTIQFHHLEPASKEDGIQPFLDV